MNRRSRGFVKLAVSLAAAMSIVLLPASGAVHAIDSLRVMTYNIWVGGTQYGPLSRTAAVIQTAQADVIGLQESGGNAAALANMLGYYYWNSGGSTAILSRYPIAQSLSQGALLQVSPTQQAYIFDVHFAPYPYQPYDFRDGLITTESQAIASAQATRGASVNALLNGMSTALASGIPVFLTGDFNEPSHLDWTPAAAAAGLNFGKKVEWPTSKAIAGAGLIDAFRELRPDEVTDRGETWTPGYPAPSIDGNEVHDRIDFVYYAGLHVTPTAAQVIGYDANDSNTDIGVQPYPSDHRSVVVEFNLPSSYLAGDLNGDSLLNVADWVQFRTWQHGNFAGLTRSEAYSRGDLSGDYRNDHADFLLFKGFFDAANGDDAFATMLAAVPEPSGGVTATWLAVAAIVWRRTAIG